ncbi:MAG: hypothetical protein IJA85_08830 [Clostridia bacterium]|nr:hypothetical protein [Clostridia bacterium]
MKKFLTAVLLILLLASCNTEGNPTKESDRMETSEADNTMVSTSAVTEAETTEPESEYTKPLSLFGDWSEFFAEGKRSNTHALTFEKTEAGYTQSRGEVEIEGPRTYASVDRAYSPAMHVNVDAYVVNPEYADDYRAAGYDVIGMSGSFNKTAYSENHPEVLQKDKNGSADAAWGSAVLTEDVLAYNIKNTVKYMLKETNWNLGFVEPEMFRDGLYGEAYKELWELKFGEAWSDPVDDVRSVFLSQRLNVWTHTNAIKTYSDYITDNQKDKSVLYHLAPHSTLAYATYGNGITDGYVHMMGTGRVGTVTGQTWSNTIENTIRYEGESAKRTFINAIVDYGTYLDAANYYGADFYALCDPMSDTHTSQPEDYWRALCHEQLVASMMYPEINRWEMIWTNRSFMNVSPDYRSEQTAIHNALFDISGRKFTLTAGTPGITYLLSDSLTWQSKNTEFAENAYDGFWGVAAPLTYDGILLRTKAMELITTAEDLADVSLLIVSYDNQKPLYENVNPAIADWVKAGGTLLYLGGPDEYLTIEDAWWNAEGKGGSPTANLLQYLGADITAQTYAGAKSSLTWLGGDSVIEDNDFLTKKFTVGGDAYTYAFDGSGFETLLKTEAGDAIGIRFAAGEGSVIMCGISTTDYSDSAAGADLLRMLTAEALKTTEYDYVTSDIFLVERGDYVALYPLEGDYTLEGSYVNIFSSDLTYVNNPVIRQGEAALYRRVSVKDQPTLLFAGGFLGEITESTDHTTVHLYAAENALAPIRIAAPAGMIPTSVKAVYAGSESNTTHIWDETTNSLLVQAVTTPTAPVTIRVEWASSGTPVKDTAYETALSVRVNNENKDEAYIISNTGSANGNYRFCDRDAEIVWSFDIAEYDGLVVSAAVVSNYVIEVSGDNETFHTVIDYSDLTSERAAGTNDSIVTIIPSAYDGIGEKLYIKLRNTDPTAGWGGAVKSFTFHTIVDQ